MPSGKEDCIDEEGHWFALAVLATSVVAAQRVRAPKVAVGRRLPATAAASTLKLPLVTPLTGGAGFLGAEQLSWAKYAVKTLAKPLGLKVKLVLGDTPVEQGAAPAQALAQKYVADKNVVGVLGPSTSGAVAASSADLLPGAASRTSRRPRRGRR